MDVFSIGLKMGLKGNTHTEIDISMLRNYEPVLDLPFFSKNVKGKMSRE